MTPRDNEDAIANFEGMIAQHVQLQAATRAISTLRKRYRAPGKRKLAARALLVVGSSGSGKSTILENYFNAHGAATETPDGDIRPVIALELPPKAGRKQIVAAFARALGFPPRDDWNTTMILERIVTHLREQKVELLLVDEAHHIVENRSDEVEEDASEFLKSLLNRSGAQIVLFGLPLLLALKEYPQLDRRLEPSFVIHPYNWDARDDREEFTAIVSLMEDEMALPVPSNLSEHFTLVRIYCVTGGHIGLVSKYLSEAFRLALDRNLDSIDLKLLGEVFAGFERGYKTQALSDNFNDKPKALKDHIDEDKNPFLVNDKKLLPLWQGMKKQRDSMVAMANRRHARATRLIGIGSEPTVF